MNKKDCIEFVKAGLRGYERLNDRSKAMTSREAWIALKLGCSEQQAAKYIAEAEAKPKAKTLSADGWTKIGEWLRDLAFRDPAADELASVLEQAGFSADDILAFNVEFRRRIASAFSKEQS